MVEYPFIALWGRQMGASMAHIVGQIKKARAEGAPATAIYYQESEETWKTIGELASSARADHMILQYINDQTAEIKRLEARINAQTH